MRPYLATLSLLLCAFAPVFGEDRPRGYAVLIGADQYDKFNNLKYCGRDAADLGRLLQGEYDFRVTILNQELAKARPELGPDARRVRDHLKRAIEDCKPGDTLVISYSGHGQQEPNKAELELTFADSDEPDSFFKLTELYTLMSKCKATQKLLILDACRKESSRDVVEDLNSDPAKLGALMEVPAPPEDVMVILSCSKGEVSLESPVFGHGLFSHFLLTEWKARAAKGEAISAAELIKSCLEPTRAYAKNRTGTPQTPQVLAGKKAKVVFSPPGAIHLRTGLKHFQARQFLEAELEFTRGLVEGPSARLYAERSSARLRRGYYSQATEDAKQAIRLAPDFPQSLIARADCYLEKAQTKEALADCVLAIKHDPAFANAYLTRAAIQFELGLFHEAYDDVSHALRLNPKDLDTLLWKIDAEDLLYYDDRAIVRAKELLKLHPEATEAMMTLSSLIEGLGDRKETERLLNQAVSILSKRLEGDPKNLSWQVGKANALRKLRKYDEAEKELQEVLKIDPKYGYAQRVLSDLYDDQNERQKALDAANQTVASYPGFSTSYLFRARVNLRLFDRDAAMRDVETGLKIAPNSPFLLWERARLFEYRREYDKAVADYSRVVSLYPNMWYAYVERGRGASSANDHERALSDFLRASELAPNNPVAQSELGDQYHALGKLDEALAMYSKALQASPTSTYAYISRGWVHYSQKDYAKATADFRKAVEGDPDDPRNYSPLGMSLFQEHKYAEAIKPLTRAIEGNSDSANVFLYRGRARMLVGDTEGMLDDFFRANKLTPPDREDADSSNFYFLWLNSRTDTDTERIDRYVRSEPENPYYYYLRSQILRRLKKFDGALANGDAILRLESKSPLGNLVRGQVFLDQGQFDKALTEFEKGLKLLPGSAALLVETSLVYSKKKDHEKALELLDKALNQEPKNKLALITRANALFDTDELDDAIEDLDVYLGLDPDDESALVLRGSIYRIRGSKAKNAADKTRDYELAVKDFTKAIERDPKDLRNYLDRGELYISLSKFVEAISDLNRVIKDEPKNDSAINFRGVAYYRQSDFVKALEDFSASVKLKPERPIYRENRARTLINLKRFDEAIPELRTLLEKKLKDIEAEDLLVDALQGRAEQRSKAGKFTDQIEDLNELIKLGEDPGPLYLKRAKARASLKDDKQAESDFAAAIKEEGNLDPLPLAERAIFFVQRERFPEANGDLERLFREGKRPFSSSSTEPGQLLCLAAEKCKNGPDEEALKLIDQLIAKYPKVGFFHWQRGILNRRLVKFDAAILDLSKAIELKYATAEVYAERAWIYNDRGEGKDYELARADADNALKLNPKNEEGQKEKLYAEIKLESYDAALKLADQMIKPDTKDTGIYQYRGMAYLEKANYDAARKDFEKMIALDERSGAAYYWLGVLANRQKKFDEGLKHLDRAVELDDDKESYLVERAVTLRELNELDDAEKDLRKAISMDEKYARAYFELARVLLKQKNYGIALKQVEIGLKAKPEDARGYEARAEIYTALGEPEKAKVDRAKAEQLKRKKK